MLKFKFILFFLTIVLNLCNGDYYTCNSVSKCDCQKIGAYRTRISCPAETLKDKHKIIIRNDYSIVSVKCENSISNITDLIPVFNGNKSSLMRAYFENCHIPSKYSLENIMDRLNLNTTQISVISLEAKEFSYLDDKFFEGITTLERVFINNYGFTNIWNALQNNNLIKHLRVENINLTTTENLNLPTCRILLIKDNNLQSIHPETFINMSKLEDLTIISDKLTTLPEDLFRNNEKITILRLMNFDKKIATIGEQFLFNLTELKKLTVSVGLHGIDATFFISNTKLVEIILSHNELTDLPKELFTKARNLFQLDLSHNKLMSLDEEIFAQNNGIKILNLNHNQFSYILPELIKPLASLTTLKLNHNELETINFNTSDFRILQELDLSHNPIDMSSFECLFQNISFAPRLKIKLNNNNITTLKSLKCLINNPKIDYIDLEDNLITEICFSNIEMNRSNLKINLKNNQINIIKFWNSDNFMHVTPKITEECGLNMGFACKEVHLTIYIDNNPVVNDILLNLPNQLNKAMVYHGINMRFVANNLTLAN